MSTRSKFLMQLFLLDGQGLPSHTKLFSVLSGCVILILFPYAVIHGSLVGYELWLVFIAALMGNRSINKLIEMRFGIQDSRTKE